jgi:nicotinamidase-related amidase
MSRAKSVKRRPVPSAIPAPAAIENAAPGALLLALDLQGNLLAALPRPIASALRARAGLALAAARALGLPVFFTEQAPEKLGPTEPAFRAAAPAAQVWAKTRFSALGAEGLLDALRAERIEHLLLLGLETPICVYQTALEARAEGLEVTVLSDAVAARRPADAEVCLAALSRAGVHVLPMETVFYALLGDARHPAFRALVAEVKAAAR